MRLAAVGLAVLAAGVGLRAEPPAPADKAAGDFNVLWDGLLSSDDATAARSILALTKRPAELLVRAKLECRPLRTTADEVRPILKQLGDADEATWHTAFEWLEYYDPRLAIGLKDLMDEVTETPARQRLVCVLLGYAAKDGDSFGKKDVKLRGVGGGFNFFADNSSWWAEDKVERLSAGWTAKKKWTRLTRTVLLLEHLNSPPAVAIIRGVADGHPDAAPTKAAKQALDRLTAKK